MPHVRVNLTVDMGSNHGLGEDSSGGTGFGKESPPVVGDRGRRRVRDGDDDPVGVEVACGGVCAQGHRTLKLRGEIGMPGVEDAPPGGVRVDADGEDKSLLTERSIARRRMERRPQRERVDTGIGETPRHVGVSVGRELNAVVRVNPILRGDPRARFAESAGRKGSEVTGTRRRDCLEGDGRVGRGASVDA